MSTASPFGSPVGPVVTRFLALKRALGRHYAHEEAILRALDHCGGSIARAAELLDISVRKVQCRLKQYRSGVPHRGPAGGGSADPSRLI